MRRFTFLIVFLAGLACAQTPADIGSDPHHRLLLQNNLVRAYSLELPPRAQSYVRHEHNFLLVTLQDGDMVVWPEGASDITSFHFREGGGSFFFGGRAQGLRNQTTAPFRGIVVEFLDPGVSTYGYQLSGQWDFGLSGVPGPVDPHAKFSTSIRLGTATAIGVQLLPGDSLAAPEKAGPELLIAVSDVDLKVGSGDHMRQARGDVAWVPARKAAYVNAGSRAAQFVLIEFHEAAPPATH